MKWGSAVSNTSTDASKWPRILCQNPITFRFHFIWMGNPLRSSHSGKKKKKWHVSSAMDSRGGDEPYWNRANPRQKHGKVHRYIWKNPCLKSMRKVRILDTVFVMDFPHGKNLSSEQTQTVWGNLVIGLKKAAMPSILVILNYQGGILFYGHRIKRGCLKKYIYILTLALAAILALQLLALYPGLLFSSCFLVGTWLLQSFASTVACHSLDVTSEADIVLQGALLVDRAGFRIDIISSFSIHFFGGPR